MKGKEEKLWGQRLLEICLLPGWWVSEPGRLTLVWIQTILGTQHRAGPTGTPSVQGMSE